MHAWEIQKERINERGRKRKEIIKSNKEERGKKQEERKGSRRKHKEGKWDDACVGALAN